MLSRYGKLHGTLSDGKIDQVDDDIDVMVTWKVMEVYHVMIDLPFMCQSSCNSWVPVLI